MSWISIKALAVQILAFCALASRLGRDRWPDPDACGGFVRYGGTFCRACRAPGRFGKSLAAGPGLGFYTGSGGQRRRPAVQVTVRSPGVPFWWRLGGRGLPMGRTNWATARPDLADPRAAACAVGAAGNRLYRAIQNFRHLYESSQSVTLPRDWRARTPAVRRGHRALGGAHPRSADLVDLHVTIYFGTSPSRPHVPMTGREFCKGSCYLACPDGIEASLPTESVSREPHRQRGRRGSFSAT